VAQPPQVAPAASGALMALLRGVSVAARPGWRRASGTALTIAGLRSPRRCGARRLFFNAG